VYSRRDDEQNAEVYLFDIKAKKEYNATQSAWNETSGQLTPDGKTLIFASNRDGGVNQLFAVPLTRLTEDPNDPLVRERIRRAGGRPWTRQRRRRRARPQRIRSAFVSISVASIAERVS
jgi:hypothetical protein